MQTTFLTRDQLEEAVRLQQQNHNGRIGEWLIRLGFVEERQITAALAQQYGLPLINLRNFSASSDALRMIPGKVAKCSGLIPVGYDDNRSSLRVAVSPPVDFSAQEAIRRMVGKKIVAYIADQSVIQRLQEQYYGPDDLDITRIPAFTSLEELIRVVSDMVTLAADSRARNIRVELVQDFLWVRLDFASESHHHIFRYFPEQVRTYERSFESEFAVAYAGAH